MTTKQEWEDRVNEARASANGQDQDQTYTFTSGGSFIFDTNPMPVPVWGRGDQVGWADGEALMFAAAQGLGKTTMGQQLTLGRCGLPGYASLLGFPIMPGERKVLYLAMDRPKQAARSFRRMVDVSQREALDDRLVVWQGPPPGDLARYPWLLAKLCADADADTVVNDSLKDAALKLSDDDVGAAYNRGRQMAIHEGAQVVELHHLRKALSGAKAQHPALDDVYGSTWLTSGAGSVILLNGNAGDPIVSMFHLKQPMAEVGPYKLFHDHDKGRTTIWHAVELVDLVRASGGISVTDAAQALFDTTAPTDAEKEKARRKLDALVRSGDLYVFDKGDPKTNRPKFWRAR